MFDFSQQIKDVEDKIERIYDVAEKYASLALSDLIELQMATDDSEDSVFWNMASYDLFKDWFFQKGKDFITIAIEIKSTGSLADAFVDADEKLGKYANEFYGEVERILNAD